MREKTQYTFIPFYLFPISCDALSFDYFGYALKSGMLQLASPEEYGYTQDKLSTSARKSSEVEIQLPLVVKPAAWLRPKRSLS
ncbi:hypothetical protein WKK05_15880 [Nostoc sp. UHCC 0302]|uniref:hypothetical protein n=1 Tax=Nostoc sp. UHCC 0302 TaxID=3134896 RepID=UPI00311CB9D5